MSAPRIKVSAENDLNPKVPMTPDINRIAANELCSNTATETPLTKPAKELLTDLTTLLKDDSKPLKIPVRTIRTEKSSNTNAPATLVRNDRIST